MSLAKTWQERKPTELEWLPSVPAQWTRTRLGWAADMVSGGTPSKAERSYWDGEIPWVSPKDMKRPEIADSIDHVTHEALRDTGLKLIEPPAVLIVVRGMILAHSFPVARILAPVTINQDMKALKFRTGIDDRFAVYLLNGIRDVILAEVEQAAHGTCRLTSQRWKKIEAYLPPIDEQRDIADFLDRETARIDRLIGQKQRLLELLDEKRTAMITQAVTKGLDPGVEMKDSGVEWLGEVPAHWEVAQIRHLSTVRRGASPRPIDDPKYFDDQGEYSWVRISDVTASRKYLSFTEQGLSNEGRARSVALPPGSLFLSIAATVGVPIITKIKCCIHDGFVYFDHLKINEDYMYYVLKTEAPFTGLGKTGTQLNLNTDTVGNIRVPVPPAEEQRRIARRLDENATEFEFLIQPLSKAIDLLQELRTSVVSRAVTGRLSPVRSAPS